MNIIIFISHLRKDNELFQVLEPTGILSNFNKNKFL